MLIENDVEKCLAKNIQVQEIKEKFQITLCVFICKLI